MKPNMMIRLGKRLYEKSYNSGGVIAYEGEDSYIDRVLEDLSALGDSLISSGIIQTDTLTFGTYQLHMTARSPFKVEIDERGVGLSLSGSLGLEIGMRNNYPEARPADPPPVPDNFTPEGIGTFTARQDGTRR